MKNIILSISLLFALISPSALYANTETAIFANCLVDALNGKERKQLAKWIFFGIAAHPTISSIVL